LVRASRKNRVDDFPLYKGETGALIRGLDWSKTSFGPISAWPAPLKATISLMLPSQAQIVLFWGPEFVALYNDAYAPTMFSGAAMAIEINPSSLRSIQVGRIEPQLMLFVSHVFRFKRARHSSLHLTHKFLTENRHGLVVEAELGPATGTTEREAAMTMVVRRSPGSRHRTLGADKAYDVHEFVDDLRDLNVTPHIAQNTTTSAVASRV
jgi:hypothetical protein